MAGTSQQVKEWGRPAGPLQRDVGAALSALSEEDLLRLRAIARLRARSLPDGMSWSDLLHEAVLRALTGARPWPPGVPLLAFLAGVMRSLCDEQWRRHRRQDHLPAPHGSGGADAKARLRCLQLPHFGHCREEHAVFQEGELLLARSRQSVSHSSLSRWTQTIYKVGT